jgi:drug/metabolite transporter (DMT)-like permease
LLALFNGPSGGVLGLAALTGLLAAASWGLGCLMFDAVHARRGKDERPLSPAGMNLYKNSLATLVFVSVGLVLGSTYPSTEVFWPLFWSGVIGFALGDSLYFAAFPLAGVQATAMVGNLTPPIAGLIAWLALGETFQASSFLWMAVVLGGVSLVIMDPQKSKGSKPVKGPKDLTLGISLALGAAICQSAAIVVAHSSFQGIEIIPGTCVRLFGGLAAAIVIAGLVSLHPKARKGALGMSETIRPFRNRLLLRALFVPTFFATLISLPLHSATVQAAPEHLSALLLSTSPLFILPLGYRFGVRQGPVSVLGTLIGFFGVAGLIWLG